MATPAGEGLFPFNHTGFAAYLRQHKLMAARCMRCGTLHLPPRELCPRCYATAMEWVELSGAGELAGFTSISVGLPEMQAQGYDREHPYCSGVVRLAEGPAISGQLVHVDCAHPETIRIGMPVQAAYLERGAGDSPQVYLTFEPR